MTDERCSKMLWQGFHQFNCRNKPKMTHEGKGYCGLHDPVKRAAKQAERDAKWQAQWEARDAAQEAAQREQRKAEHALRWHDDLVKALTEAAGYCEHGGYEGAAEAYRDLLAQIKANAPDD